METRIGAISNGKQMLVASSIPNSDYRWDAKNNVANVTVFVFFNDTTNPDGYTFTTSVLDQERGQSGAAMAYFADRFWVSFLSWNGDNRILICNSQDGSTHWSGNIAVPNQSAQNQLAPSLASYGQKLWVAFISNDDNDRILLCSSSNPSVASSWSGNVTIPNQSAQGSPSLAVFADTNELYVAFISNDTHNRILLCWSSDPSNPAKWSGDIAIPGQSSQSTPSLAFFNHKLWVAFISNDNNNKVLLCSSSNPSDPASWSGNISVAGQTSSTAPSLFVYEGQLWLAFVSNDEYAAICFCSSTQNGTNWTRVNYIGEP